MILIASVNPILTGGSTERMTEGRTYERSRALFETRHFSTDTVVYEEAEGTDIPLTPF